MAQPGKALMLRRGVCALNTQGQGLCQGCADIGPATCQARGVSLLSLAQRDVTGTCDTYHLCWHSYSVAGDPSQYLIKAGVRGRLALLLAMAKLKQQPGCCPHNPQAGTAAWQVPGGHHWHRQCHFTARGRSVYPGVSMNFFKSVHALGEAVNEAKGGEM